MSDSASTPDGTDVADDLAPTQTHPVGFVPPPRGESGPHFGPPAQAGELGTFGRYRVLQQLGQGGMGAVYLGYDGALGRKVALKMMLSRHAADPESRDRFMREARLAASITSDHVVTIFDVGEERPAAGSAGRAASSNERPATGSAGRAAGSDERGFPFIAMEYLQGFPLDQYLRTKGELPLPHILRIGREVALGLAAAHEKGLIHRDIKPGNIWLEHPKGRVKILDFGLARAQTDDTHLTGTGLVVGTPTYMSPEQGRGLKLDGRSDLFSLGILLYRLCTGRLPFGGSTTMAVLTSLAVDTPVPPRTLNPQLPTAVAALVTKLLAKNPAERYQTAIEVADALLAAGRTPSVAELPVAVPLSVGAQPQNVWENIDASESSAVPLSSGAESEPASETVPAPRARRSRLPLILAGAALGLAVAAVVAVLVWPEKKPEVTHVEPPKPAPPERVVTPPKANDPERKAAEFALAHGAEVRVTSDEKEIIARQLADLPVNPFTLTGLDLVGRQWTDADVEAFHDLPALTRLVLRDTSVTEPGLKTLRSSARLEELRIEDTQMSDVGVGYFGHSKDLRVLSLRGAGITNYGVSFFGNCAKLAWVDLRGTSVDDAGLVHLEWLTVLDALDLRNTKVTETGVKALAAKLPYCRIEWDGGAVGPPADVRAARWVLSVGGVVGLDGHGTIDRLDQLPKEPYRLNAIYSTGRAISDADLIRFRDCSDLAELYLGDCRRLKDSGLANFAGRDNVRVLVISGCPHVTDAGLAHFKNCKGLETLAVHGCQRITDAGLAHFAGCPVLGSLNLGSCFRISDAGLAHFKGVTTLRHLNLNRCASVSDAGLAHFKDSRGLETLFLNECPRISDAGLEPFKGVTALLDVQLYNTTVTDTGVSHLGGCKGMRKLVLRSTRVTDAALDHLTGMPLVELDLRGTKVTAGRVDALRKALPECHVAWGGPPK